ncbi:myosin heavy chain, clone 203-like [Gossypium hirsutum]|uniref:Myosin heavy chain, clone 203-like n=1 Tax=Gossypium hirsutum TaxID=3635 RepID=A0ABM3BXS0_GOSHI|nr:myosin heavy chain, clone 203-like [Gossypium hirsutum]
MTTPEYDRWWNQRINDNIPTSDQGNPQSIEEHLKVVPSELEIIRQDFERKIKEEQSKANQWEKKFRDAQTREGALKRSLVERQNEKEGLKIRVSELERSLYQYRSRNSAIELKASQNRIEELKENIEELKTALQNRELQIELLVVNNERWKEQLHQSQDQVRSRDYVMGEALTQVREVADHLQTFTVQADVLSLKYESESDRGQKLAWLLRQKSMMDQLTRLLAGGLEKGKSPLINAEEDNKDPTYPPGFAPTDV